MVPERLLAFKLREVTRESLLQTIPVQWHGEEMEEFQEESK